MIAYETVKPNEPLMLYTGDFELRGKRRVVSATGSVAVSWFPKPKLFIDPKTDAKNTLWTSCYFIRQALTIQWRRASSRHVNRLDGAEPYCSDDPGIRSDGSVIQNSYS